MKKSLRVFGCAVLLAVAGALHATSAADAAAKIAAARLLDGVTGAAGMKSLRGAKAAWDEVLVQKGMEATMPSLETDLKTTDVEGALRTADFRIMDPKKRSLAVGLRPTLSVVVIFQPKGPDLDQSSLPGADQRRPGLLTLRRADPVYGHLGQNQRCYRQFGRHPERH